MLQSDHWERIRIINDHTTIRCKVMRQMQRAVFPMLVAGMVTLLYKLTPLRCRSGITSCWRTTGDRRGSWK